jgi:hypothetical protein
MKNRVGVHDQGAHSAGVQYMRVLGLGVCDAGAHGLCVYGMGMLNVDRQGVVWACNVTFLK